MTDIVFMDTETLGLDIDAPIWEFAAIRRHINSPEVADASGITSTECRLHIQIHHYPDPWLAGPDALPEQFAADYRDRFDPANALSIPVAAALIEGFLSGRPHIIGAVPSFDTARISHQLLRPARIPDPWHYHLIDVENVVVGYLAGKGELFPPPWKSDQLSAAVGVDPEVFDRHTAMGDVLWTRAQWDAVMGCSPRE
ncbi:hypothetical protein AOT83_26355 [Mycobacteroides sp. H001]|uniref:hypothetical protein n=1 Tax=unclassified Mycobacteroides TaxID=2618759 RepID=UPI000713AAB4|nr:MULTISPECIES: hypothetical protein [unclassified Mycobacteroides]KRQ29774.1 hypothetical protein AOT84_26230 [Mycobacteroides sp. H002]KRQ29895.1 hypothetical protein AOT86_04150 [Mycobacteroides sp. H072]KRQ48355.1 hypothetical protein AOT85_18800 [Mycobacteroides sp. H054]KRQ65144.1 hypothetical protein AOT83_26355 [Mycobacteroides sp. H001]